MIANLWVLGGQGVVWVSEQDKVMAHPPILVTVKEGGAGTRVAEECCMQQGLQHGTGARSMRGRTTSNVLPKHTRGGSGSVRQRQFWCLPNKTKLPQKVLAVTIGNSEKNKVQIM